MKKFLFATFVILFAVFLMLSHIIYDGQSISENGFDSIEKYINLIENSGFEEGLDGWNIRIGRGAEIDLDPTVSFSGNQSLRIRRTDYGYGYASQNFYFGNQTVKNFLLSGWAKSENATTRYHFFDLWGRAFYEDGESELYTRVEFSHGTHDWEYRSLAIAFNESKRVDYVTVYVRFQDEGGTVWFDDISFVWTDANVQVRCVDESSVSLINANIKLYSGVELIEERYTDENGIANFLLSTNNTYSLVIYWKGIVVERKDDVEVLNDVELLLSCDVSFETELVSIFLKDILGRSLQNKEVEVRFRLLTSTEYFLVEHFSTDENGKIEGSLLAGPGEIRVLFTSGGDVYEAKKVLVVGPNSNIELRFGFVNLFGLILPVADFALYSVVGVFLSITLPQLFYYIYCWKKSEQRLRMKHSNVK